jgi:AraC-like DNA-binding protein
MEWIPEKDECNTYSTNFWNSVCHFSEERPLQLPDGTWLFGQEQGAYTATQQSLNSIGYKPPLVFTELAVSGKPVRLDVALRDTLVIGTDERSFVLSYAALDYTDNSDICYRSRMNGGPWSNSSSKHSLTFYGILPGKYLLEVQSTDHYGRWVDNTRRLTLIVLPHWYETLWAKLLGLMLLVAIIVTCIYTIYYIRNLHRQRRELLKKYMDLLARADVDKQSPIQEPATTLLDVSDVDRRFLDKVKEYINANIGNSDANIDDMAAFSAVSRSTLNRKLRSLLGITATQLLIDARMEKARHMLISTSEQVEGLSVTEIAYQCGYTDPRYFSRCFKQKYGKTPTEYAG